MGWLKFNLPPPNQDAFQTPQNARKTIKATSGAILLSVDSNIGSLNTALKSVLQKDEATPEKTHNPFFATPSQQNTQLLVKDTPQGSLELIRQVKGDCETKGKEELNKIETMKEIDLNKDDIEVDNKDSKVESKGNEEELDEAEKDLNEIHATLELITTPVILKYDTIEATPLISAETPKAIMDEDVIKSPSERKLKQKEDEKLKADQIPSTIQENVNADDECTKDEISITENLVVENAKIENLASQVLLMTPDACKVATQLTDKPSEESVSETKTTETISNIEKDQKHLIENENIPVAVSGSFYEPLIQSQMTPDVIEKSQPSSALKIINTAKTPSKVTVMETPFKKQTIIVPSSNPYSTKKPIEIMSQEATQPIARHDQPNISGIFKSYPNILDILVEKRKLSETGKEPKKPKWDDHNESEIEERPIVIEEKENTKPPSIVLNQEFNSSYENQTPRLGEIPELTWKPSEFTETEKLSGLTETEKPSALTEGGNQIEKFPIVDKKKFLDKFVQSCVYPSSSLKINSLIWAKWRDGIYYPAKILKRAAPRSKTIEVIFSDGTKYKAPKGACHIFQLSVNTLVKISSSKEGHNGIVVEFESLSNIKIDVDNVMQIFTIQDIAMDEEMFQKANMPKTPKRPHSRLKQLRGVETLSSSVRSPFSSKFNVGDVVWAPWSDNYFYSATVTNVKPLELVYNDGDSCNVRAENQIFLATLNEGDTVLVKKNDCFEKAKIRQRINSMIFLLSINGTIVKESLVGMAMTKDLIDKCYTSKRQSKAEIIDSPEKMATDTHRMRQLKGRILFPSDSSFDIFKGLFFYITLSSKENIYSVNKQELCKNIKKYSGSILENFDNVPFASKSHILLSNMPCRTIKYLKALALNLQIISRTVLPFDQFYLPTGFSKQENNYVNPLTMPSPVFDSLNMSVYGESGFHEEWTDLCQLAGATMYVNLPDECMGVMYVVFPGSPPDDWKDEITRFNYHIESVNTEWIIQSLIHRQILDIQECYMA
ncbi:hypothetical protein O9G_003175 [Rozella allomycis CSF55]|uniref:BRCT domain-containing protein n=1 Tax=Rozella allomycis (strain CSF55) TaxID=988480 RepID=A0A075AVF4_ROZAC|nr:hypothetical protein O9G_003175 [Rozella allomycis CSF55]|eukprot:EPZ34095.1 hypothetical protein O9G_003175 [Rozella allomycis CSF55]